MVNVETALFSSGPLSINYIILFHLSSFIINLSLSDQQKRSVLQSTLFWVLVVKNIIFPYPFINSEKCHPC